MLCVCMHKFRSISFVSSRWYCLFSHSHGLRTPREEIAFTARPKIQSQSQIFRYGRSIFCLPHRPNFSDIFDLCLHWVSVVRAYYYTVGLFLFLKYAFKCASPVDDNLAISRSLVSTSARQSLQLHTKPLSMLSYFLSKCIHTRPT